ncbi:iron uptake transporter deferrochelatase/peroxidase subunit [Phaeacidiphilus oryzae]|uniref:iron uptake transporter deferrochelatase/peroxidase subunit n=1 Tax=Phaeacidiphilus oryzae TaxID=348818 RepID=UPI00056D579D|nr:iron uptake transporter deferrochelatase/peroxidase subunit [Phaeacidiphilus oryzae]
MQDTASTDQRPDAGQDPSGVSRRRLLGAASAAGVAGLVVGAGGTALGEALTEPGRPTPLDSVGSTRIPFHGARQAGIVEPQQARMYAAAFDLTPTGADRRAVAALMRRWSSAAATMAEGGTPPQDDGAALDAGPSSLTVTFGFGRGLFDRIGLAAHRPEALAELPSFPGDRIDAARSGGDLWVQVCADDALVAFRALRVLQRRAAGTATLRWQMSGFSRAPGAAPAGGTPRNLMGMKDGTGNPAPGDASFDSTVFVGGNGAPSSPSSPPWMANGSYAVFRRIRILLDHWDVLPVDRQERIIGRHKRSGAPLSGGGEFTAADLSATTASGGFAIPADAHIRVAAPASNQGAAMLRRGFSYHDGLRPDGEPDAGLLFVCFQSDPLTGFVPVQRKLSRGDALSQFLVHESSGVYAVPGGAAADGYVGQELLES